MTSGCRRRGQQAEPMVGPDAFLFFARQSYAAFPDIKPGDRYYLAPAARVHLW